MSSQTWFNHMQAAFPNWTMFDSSGNNFYMTRDLLSTDGTPIMIGIAENVSYVLRHKDSGRFVAFAEWDVQNDADDVTGVERAYDVPELFQPLYLIDDRNGELYEAQGGVARLFDEETRQYIRSSMLAFLDAYRNNWS
ncbi:hypothetical protein [Alicyclobacillus fastidiosus]|uniref:Uncharacterized protein n=1 Tax=Alicyclobacillus fastidiosus TaxID=392011 RepID=A0ABV5AHH3_9BACL|nr:hypothetical protein [Alicyclobacillus fastidiosus]WEH09181.1 hypothetical protein PYS47_21315 [Alicyclobacillus fastidiosus]